MDRTSGSPAIAFLCAMPMELRPLVRKLSLHRSQLDGVTVHRGTFGGHPVVASVTGMGTKRAAEASRRLLDAVTVERVVVVGITGAVDDVTPIGTLVVPEAVVDSATGAEHRPTPLGPGTPHGKMWTTDDLLTDLDAIAELRTAGVVSLDMETAAVAEVCERRGIPWSVFRAISDRATDGRVDGEVFRLSKPGGSPDVAAVVRYLFTHPGRIPLLVGLARGARLATETAADAALRACSDP